MTPITKPEGFVGDRAKYKCGNPIWLMHNNRPITLYVYQINTSNQANWKIWYTLTSTPGYYMTVSVQVWEDDAFETKQDLIDHLIAMK